MSDAAEPPIDRRFEVEREAQRDPLLHHALKLYQYGRCSYVEALEIAAVEQSKRAAEMRETMARWLAESPISHSLPVEPPITSTPIKCDRCGMVVNWRRPDGSETLLGHICPVTPGAGYRIAPYAPPFKMAEEDVRVLAALIDASLGAGVTMFFDGMPMRIASLDLETGKP